MAKVAQLDKEGFFIQETEDYGGPMPQGCIAQFPPEDVLPEYCRWRYDGKNYAITPDYRSVEVYTQDGTAYRPQSYGPLAEDVSLTKPEPPADIIGTQRIEEIKTEIRRLEAAAQRPLIALYMKMDEPYDYEKLAEITQKIIDLRCELQAIEYSLQG